MLVHQQEVVHEQQRALKEEPVALCGVRIDVDAVLPQVSCGRTRNQLLRQCFDVEEVHIRGRVSQHGMLDVIAVIG